MTIMMRFFLVMLFAIQSNASTSYDFLCELNKGIKKEFLLLEKKELQQTLDHVEKNIKKKDDDIWYKIHALRFLYQLNNRVLSSIKNSKETLTPEILQSYLTNLGLLGQKENQKLLIEQGIIPGEKNVFEKIGKKISNIPVKTLVVLGLIGGAAAQQYINAEKTGESYNKFSDQLITYDPQYFNHTIPQKFGYAGSQVVDINGKKYLANSDFKNHYVCPKKTDDLTRKCANIFRETQKHLNHCIIACKGLREPQRFNGYEVEGPWCGYYSSCLEEDGNTLGTGFKFLMDPETMKHFKISYEGDKWSIFINHNSMLTQAFKKELLYLFHRGDKWIARAFDLNYIFKKEEYEFSFRTGHCTRKDDPDYVPPESDPDEIY